MVGIAIFIFGLIVLVSAIGDHHTHTSPTPQQPAPYN
jgi:hypothetical protein